MCDVVRQGLRLLNAAHAAERREKQRAARLFSSPPWENARERLLEGLRAIHLVCSTGLVTGTTDLQDGADTLQQACDVEQVRTAAAK